MNFTSPRTLRRTPCNGASPASGSLRSSFLAIRTLTFYVPKERGREREVEGTIIRYCRRIAVISLSETTEIINSHYLRITIRLRALKSTVRRRRQRGGRCQCRRYRMKLRLINNRHRKLRALRRTSGEPHRARSSVARDTNGRGGAMALNGDVIT